MEKIFVEEGINDLHTIQDMLRWAMSCFVAEDIHYGHGTDNAWDEAVQLILPTLWLPLNISEKIRYSRLTRSERNNILERVLRRVNERIPIAYLTNKSWFFGHEFYVNQDVIIPRSPIGELIENKFSGLIKKTPESILDMCTGSGCIAISCSYAFPNAQITAVDICQNALKVARKNINIHQCYDSITLLHADLFRNIPKVKYDLILTNPPYVHPEDMKSLPREYSYEPQIGLVGGSDGLKIVRQILACASDFLNENGILICEVGNSYINIMHQYPDIPFTWIEFESGAKGVFMLTREQIIALQHHFFL